MCDDLGKNQYAWLAQSTFHNDDMELGKVLENEAEYVGKDLTTDNCVPGRLRRAPEFATFYRKVIGADREVVDIFSARYLYLL